MLCHSCERQTRCLPAQFSQADDTLAAMLNQLQDCSLKVSSPARPGGWAWGQRWWKTFRQSLQRWSQCWRMGSA